VPYLRVVQRSVFRFKGSRCNCEMSRHNSVQFLLGGA
jgi:hypothetical protein